MSFSIGIVGLPNAGKSTLFKALTKKEVDIASYPFTTIEPNIGIVPVPDKRLEKIARIAKSEKVTPTVIEFVDIAGIVKGAHRGEGLGNQFLAHIRECDAILHVIRNFSLAKENGQIAENTQETHYDLSECPNPERDIKIIREEMRMKDLETVRNNLEKLSKSQDKIIQKKVKILEKIHQGMLSGKAVSELKLLDREIDLIKEYNFLTQKPVIYVFNTTEETDSKPSETCFPDPPPLSLNLKIEEEALELSEKERQELQVRSHLDSLINACYNILDLITFYTIAGFEETRAWTLQKGEKCPQAGGVVHSDFKEKFIRAEVISWKDLVAAGGWREAKENGLIRTEGKDYIVRDGDVIEFKI